MCLRTSNGIIQLVSGGIINSQKSWALYTLVHIESTSYSRHRPTRHPNKESHKQKQEIHGARNTNMRLEIQCANRKQQGVRTTVS